MSTYASELAEQAAHAVRCAYCNRENRPNEGMVIIRKAIKRRYQFNRWQPTGDYCCDDCIAAGKPWRFGYYLNEF